MNSVRIKKDKDIIRELEAELSIVRQKISDGSDKKDSKSNWLDNEINSEIRKKVKRKKMAI